MQSATGEPAFINHPFGPFLIVTVGDEIDLLVRVTV